jgi:hypothetical protein
MRTAFKPLHDAFPAKGHVYEADFGVYAFQLDVRSDAEMTLTGTKGLSEGTKETVRIIVTPIRDGIFVVRWQEASGNRVVYIEDYKAASVHSFISTAKGELMHMHGRLKKIS